MATNHYFNHYGTNTADQRLIESIIIESIKVYGIDLHYMPRTLVNEDKLFGEDRISQFKDSRIIEMYIKNVDGFEGEGTLVYNFGLEVRDQSTLTVSRRRFRELNFDPRYFMVKSLASNNPFIFLFNVLVFAPSTIFGLF